MKEVYVSQEIGRNGSKKVLFVNHSARTYTTGDSMNTTIPMHSVNNVPSYRLSFLESNIKSKGYQYLGRR